MSGFGSPSLSSPLMPLNPPTTPAPASSKQVTDLGLALVVFILGLMLTIKLSQTVFPLSTCSQTELTLEESEECERFNRTRMNLQYVCALVLGSVLIIVSLALAMKNKGSRSALLGVAYSGMATILVSIWSNYSRLSNTSQVLIIGLFFVGLAALPSLTKQVLVQ
jgi:hypothetical protein